MEKLMIGDWYLSVSVLYTLQIIFQEFLGCHILLTVDFQSLYQQLIYLWRVKQNAVLIVCAVPPRAFVHSTAASVSELERDKTAAIIIS